ncbi:MAG: Gldg family protein, partial [Deltaproteobacteria bacterium]|nr:Gldg family protein [Deltaproteobacteria bacterium]
MAIKETGKESPAERRGAKAARELPRQRRELTGGPSTADRFNAWAFFGTMGSWLALLLGQRVLDSIEWFASLLTYLAVAGLVVCFGQRVWAASQASVDRRSGARALALFSGLGIVALAVFYATTNGGREMLGVEVPKLGQPDLYGEIATVAWISLVLLSIVPSLLGELARLSMLRAERVESRRVVAAVVAGVAISCAAVYGSLFAYSADKMDVFADFSYFRVAKPSDSTRRMLDSLDEPLKVLVFFPGFSEVRPRVVQYLEELRKGTDKLEIEVLDRELYPDRAHEHKVTKDGVLVLVSGKNSKKLQIGDVPAKAARKLKKLDGEFQKVLLQAMRKKRTVYLTVGHGELNESTGRKSLRTVKLLRQLMESQNYGIKNLGLAKGLGNEVPDDAAVVAILGPTEAFSEPEME